jgi:hypothetical protein
LFRLHSLGCGFEPLPPRLLSTGAAPGKPAQVVGGALDLSEGLILT